MLTFIRPKANATQLHHIWTRPAPSAHPVATGWAAAAAQNHRLQNELTPHLAPLGQGAAQATRSPASTPETSLRGAGHAVGVHMSEVPLSKTAQGKQRAAVTIGLPHPCAENPSWAAVGRAASIGGSIGLLASLPFSVSSGLCAFVTGGCLHGLLAGVWAGLKVGAAVGGFAAGVGALAAAACALGVWTARQHNSAAWSGAFEEWSGRLALVPRYLVAVSAGIEAAAVEVFQTSPSA